MGLFGNMKPKLPSYVGAGLGGLLQDSRWANAITQAGIDTGSCEIVLRLSETTVGAPGILTTARPAILLGHGNTLALAFPSEREVKVLQHDKTTAKLQAQASGFLQIHFGEPNGPDVFIFRGTEDNLRLGTPEGKAFEKTMSAFVKGQLTPQQLFGTPRHLAASGVSVEIPATVFDDPEDALRWELVHSLHVSLSTLMEKLEQCSEKAQFVEKCFGIANSEFVNGVRQAEASRRGFYNSAVKADRELEVLLVGLREATMEARNKWENLLFVLPGSENDVMKLVSWCTSHGVDSEVWSYVATNGMLTQTNFGVTRESFWTENDRVIAVMKGAGQ